MPGQTKSQRPRRWAVMLAAAAGVTGLLVAAQSARAQSEIDGYARVVSGDELRVGSTLIRLFGLDAPELYQYCENEYGRPYQCGIMAADALGAMVGQANIRCLPKGRSRETGAVLAICYVGDMNLNSRLVRTGWAVARAEQRPDYAVLENLARREKAGIWQFIFEDPADWRAENADN